MFSKAKRSAIMARIKSNGSGLDMRTRDILEKSGLKFEQYPRLYGRPDFLVGRNVIVFCDSSFWHGRNWSSLKKQLTNGHNAEYWVKHIAKNRARDREVTRRLQQEGYKVIRFWDIDIYENPDRCIATLVKEFDEESSAH